MIPRYLCRWLLLGGALLLGLLLCLALAWYNFQSSSEFNGRYESAGSVVQKDGQVLPVSHSMLIKDGRFYAMSRQGDTILKTSGEVESAFAGHLRLRVDKGEVAELSQASRLDNHVLFNLLYSTEADSVINLRPAGPCLIAVETRQLYCRSDGL
ncbi:hypothetical protein [Aquipseudomonas alcaligenes]|uniref:hypothetical protein n=1 Tax=Aquipseudomonas alcaligenes TaxID=43263 RepID=UPI003748C0AE